MLLISIYEIHKFAAVREDMKSFLDRQSIPALPQCIKEPEDDALS